MVKAASPAPKRRTVASGTLIATDINPRKDLIDTLSATGKVFLLPSPATITKFKMLPAAGL